MTMMTPHKRYAALAVSALTLLASASAEATTVRGFEGTGLLDNVTLGNAFRPPDTMGAVGTTQYLESTNGSYTVYNKATGAVQQRISFGDFWANAGQTGAQGDQRILFDHFTNRWITLGFGASVSDIQIAVSDTSNAMGTWKSTKFTAFPGGTADYPTLGMDQKGVYIGTNNFTASFVGTSLFVIPKADLFGGAPTTANKTSFVEPYPASTTRGFAIQGAVNWGPNPTNTGKVLAVDLLADRQNFYTLNGVNAAGATRSAVTNVQGANYNAPNPGRQPNGSRVVDTLDDRISSNVYEANGKLYTVHTVTPLGTDFTAVRWSVINSTTGALIEEGDISGNNFDYYQGSIAVNEFGEVVIGYNRSGGSEKGIDGRISFMARTFATDAGGGIDQTGSELLLKRSSVDDYHCGVRVNPAPCRERWGDYSSVTLDPNNHHSFYAIGEYAADWAILPGFTNDERAIWHTFIAEIDLSAAAIPEPSTYALMGLGLLAVGAMRRKR